MRWMCWICLLATAAKASDSAYSAARAQQEASVEKQLASARAQEAAVAARKTASFAPATVAAVEPACDRIPLAEAGKIVDEGARRAGLDAPLVRAVVRQESAFDSCAT